MLALGLLLLFLCSPSHSAPQEPQVGLENRLPPEAPSSGGELEERGLEELEQYLGAVLETGEAPLIWIQEGGDDQEQEQEEGFVERPWKRARYYRRYPWKRQNGRNYDPEGYLCAPSREDVFQLIMALHDARNGNTDRTLTFCNRRRPAKAVFTNIRFLGRR